MTTTVQVMDWQGESAVRTMWQECRGEPLEGQQAVAHSMLNRVKDGRWGKTLGSVVHSHWQYSAWWASDHNDVLLLRESCELPEDDPALRELRAVLWAAMSGESDLTGGATHYYAESIPQPFWVKGATFCGKFGSQLFYKNVK